jgi:threonine dehydrogenase-like Zn-dependent dehydrogenase
MRAVTFNFSIPRYVLGRALGGITDSAAFGRLSGVRLSEVPVPPPPGDRWIGAAVIAGGICGTDLGSLTFNTSPLMEPFASFPCVLGHEILARVTDVGSAVTRVRPGQRIVLDPIVSCTVRGFPDDELCASCAAGIPGACARGGQDGPLQIGGRALARGLSLGFHRDLPGGWGERLIAHESQVYPVDDALDDCTAVLMEPLSVAVHAVLHTLTEATERVLVIGSGPIAFATIWALRALGFAGDIVAQAKRSHECDLADQLGATQTVTPGDSARSAMLQTGAAAYRPPVGPEVYAGGGFPLVYDCVGNRQTLDQGLRYAAPRGKLVLLGCAGARTLDLTMVWAREVAIRGVLGYGRERWDGETLHTYELTQRLLLATDAPVTDLVTHTYPLHHYRRALGAARHRRRSGAVKVLLTP